jgi:hypothetical protein
LILHAIGASTGLVAACPVSPPKKSRTALELAIRGVTFEGTEHREVQRLKASRFFITALRKDTRITMRKSVLMSGEVDESAKTVTVAKLAMLK